MNITDFKAGHYEKGFKYQYFMPNEINQSFEWNDAQLNELLEEASLQVGQLNAFSHLVPDAAMFIKMHIANEAVLSSRIEGTQTQLTEAFLRSEDIAVERRDDWSEIHNYINAVNHAIQSLDELPLSGRLLRQTHKILLQGVRGKYKLPGEFRTSQNWIGGASLSDATFIPPAHEEVPRLMADLEHFLHNTDIKVPHLIKAGIAHYQFETIHPFLDGNGRLGRLLIVLYLVEKKVLTEPLLYISDFFDHHRQLYYPHLNNVRVNNDLRQWLLFFLVGVRDTAQKAVSTLNNIILLKHESEAKISSLGKKSAKAQRILQYLWSQPTLRSADVCSLLEVTPKTANQLLEDLQRLEILKEITNQQRNRIFAFQPYLELFE